MRRLVFGLVFLAVCGTAVAQQPPPPGLPSPRLQHVFPLGAQDGTGVDVTVTGNDLEEPEKLLVAHPGLKGEYLAPPKEGKPDPKDPKKTRPPPKVNPAGPHKFKVTAAADVPPGLYDLRVVGKWGVSNPRTFAGKQPSSVGGAVSVTISIRLTFYHETDASNEAGDTAAGVDVTPIATWSGAPACHEFVEAPR